MEEGVEIDELEEALCSEEKEVVWTTSKHNEQLNFHAGNLKPQWVLFKLICNRLIPTMHTSHVTLDKVVLLYAMIKKKKVNAGWIILT